MKRLLFFILILFIANKTSAQQDIFNNESIVKMYNAGISKEVIIKKIQTSDSYSFDISTDELVKLKTKKIPDTILLILIEKVSVNSKNNFTGNITKSKPTENTNSNNILSNEKIPKGLSFFDKTDNTFKFFPRCHPSTISTPQQKSTSLFFNPFNSIDDDVIYYFDGSKSTFQITDNSPVFYCRASEGEDAMFAGADLESFLLYNAIVRKNSRKIFIDKKSNYVKPITTLIKKDVIRITFEKKLPIGNYFLCIGNGIFYEFDVVK